MKNSKLDLALSLAMRRAVIMVEADAKKKAPVDDGILRASITHNVESNDTEVIGTVGSNVEYAPYVEYGTGLFTSMGEGRKTPWTYQDAKGRWITTAGQHPQPFLQPALNENRDKIVKSIARDLMRNVNITGK